MRGYSGFLYARWSDQRYSYDWSDLLKKIKTENQNEYDGYVMQYALRKVVRHTDGTRQGWWHDKWAACGLFMALVHGQGFDRNVWRVRWRRGVRLIRKCLKCKRCMTIWYRSSVWRRFAWPGCRHVMTYASSRVGEPVLDFGSLCWIWLATAGEENINAA